MEVCPPFLPFLLVTEELDKVFIDDWRPSVVTHSSNLTFSGGRASKIKAQGQLEQIVRSYLKNKPGIMAHACGPSYLGGGGGKITVLGQKCETLPEK
jgi:hypothetical protein